MSNNTMSKVKMKEVDVPVTQKIKVIDWDRMDVGIQHVGNAITLPAHPEAMPLSKAIEALMRKAKDEEQIFQVNEVIDAFPHDGAVAFYWAMEELYGWSSPQTQQTIFGPKPPTMLSIKVGPGIDNVIQCPLGMFKLPGVDEPVYTRFGEDAKGQPCFIIYGEVKKKHRQTVLDLAILTRKLVREQSIYRGKPIRLGVDDSGGLMMDTPPEFLDVTDISEADVLFDEAIRNQIDTNMLVPIRETDRCVQLGIPLKRGILLEGPFGTGKSLTARMVAMVAERHGWTFVLLDKVQGLRTALEFANRYSPAVVFAEDIDRIAEVRDDGMNDLVNMIDGVVSKSAKIMTILTTNFVEKLDTVILRPGRLDAVISIRAPNADTVQKLIRHYAKGLLADGETLEGAGKELKGQIPASIRECVERAKLAMVGRRANTLADADLVVTAQTMKNHLALLNKDKGEPSLGDELVRNLREVVGDHPGGGNERDLSEQITEVSERTSVANSRLKKVDRRTEKMAVKMGVPD